MLRPVLTVSPPRGESDHLDIGDPAELGAAALITRLHLSPEIQYGILAERLQPQAEAVRAWLLVNLIPGEPMRGEPGSVLQPFADTLGTSGAWLAARDLPLGLHYDTIPAPGTRNTLVVFRRDTRGGYLVFPTLRKALLCADLSVARFVGTDLLHGSTLTTGSGYRIALTLYG